MSKTFIVLGYGIPKDIEKDINYQTYLALVFNYIYESSKFEKCTVITSGGETDIVIPYKRTEAGEMIKVLKELTNRPFIKSAGKYWKFYQEPKSLSSLENLLFAGKLITQNKLSANEIIIFCEHTRLNRIKKTAKKIFASAVKVVSFDFDISSNRYLDPKFIKQKEDEVLKHSLWALQSEENLEKHHQLFVEKVKRLREVGTNGHQQEILLWWEEKLVK